MTTDRREEAREALRTLSDLYYEDALMAGRARKALDVIEAFIAADPPALDAMTAQRNHYLAGCRCTMRGYCVPHGWAGTVEPDDHEICADHDHVEPDPSSEAEDAALAADPPALDARLFDAVRRVIRDGIDSPGTYNELHEAFYAVRDARLAREETP